MANPTELHDRARHARAVDCLAMPAIRVLEERDALPFDGPRDDEGGNLEIGRRRRVGDPDRHDVVSVDLDRSPAERTRALGIDGRAPAERRLPALPETVHVEDRHDVSEA